MQVQVTANGLERRVTVAVPAERINQEVESRLKKLTRQVRVDGFRAGKVPYKVVQQRWGGSVRQEVCGELVQSSFNEAVYKERLRPVGVPRFELQPESTGVGLAYTAVFEVYPEFEVKLLTGMHVTKPVVQIIDADLEKMVDKLRWQRVHFHATERAAQRDDRLNIDFLGKVDGREFSGNVAHSYTLVLGSNSMVPGFEDALIGLKAGAEKGFDVGFPENYRAADLAGKRVHFDVKVHEVAEPRLPELNDEFYKSFGVYQGGEEAFRREVRANMERELAGAIKDKVKNQVMDALLQENPISLPNALIENEISDMQAQARAYTPTQDKRVGETQTIVREQAARRVALGLVISEIVKRNAFSAEPDRVRAAVEAIATTYERPEEIVQWYYGQRERLSAVEALVLEDQAVEWVLKHAEMHEQVMNFDELVGHGSSTTAT